MKSKNIELADISKYRSELMGIAIVFVALFHVPLSSDELLFGLYRCGNIGVDIFLFLSGIGLWFSWTKNPSVRSFYKRRLLRIYPTWLIIAVMYFPLQIDYQTAVLKDYVRLLVDVLFYWSYWRNHDLTFWFIPTIILFYLWAPWYMKLIQKYPVYRWSPVLMIVGCVILHWVQPFGSRFMELEITWSRIPIFFIGINIGETIRLKQNVEPEGRWLVLLALLMSSGISIYFETVVESFPNFVERMVYIPFSISLVLLLIDILNRIPEWSLKYLASLGGISLEVYMLHFYFVMIYLIPLQLGYWTTALITLIITIPLSWILHRITDKLFLK